MTTALAPTDRRVEPRTFGAIKVADAMHAGVITCAPDASLTVIARTMAAHRIHSVVVPLDPAQGVWGIVSDADIVAALGADGLAARTAREFAASGRLTVRDDDSLAAAAQVLHDSGDTHLIVLDRCARPVGVLSMLDLLDALAELEGPGSER
jgi:CBS domain-containing protein